MGIEHTLRRLAIACALLLLLAPLTPRTSWVGGDGHETRGTSSMRHSAGWDWVMPVCGIAAILGLATGRRARPGGAFRVVGVAVALIAFTGAAVAAGGHWRDAAGGALDMRGFMTRPAPGALPFALVALLGAGCALALAVGWLRSAGGEG